MHVPYLFSGERSIRTLGKKPGVCSSLSFEGGGFEPFTVE